jgi:hypothetical protein
MPLVRANLSPILWLAFSHTKAIVIPRWRGRIAVTLITGQISDKSWQDNSQSEDGHSLSY